MNEAEITIQHTLIKKIEMATRATAEVDQDGEITVRPEMLSRRIFERLLDALKDYPHTFMVSRNLEIKIFKI